MVLRPGNNLSAGRHAHVHTVIDSEFPAEASKWSVPNHKPRITLEHAEGQDRKTLPKFDRLFTRNLFSAIYPYPGVPWSGRMSSPGRRVRWRARSSQFDASLASFLGNYTKGQLCACAPTLAQVFGTMGGIRGLGCKGAKAGVVRAQGSENFFSESG